MPSPPNARVHGISSTPLTVLLPWRDQPLESPCRHLWRLAVRMVGIVEPLHFQSILLGPLPFAPERDESTGVLSLVVPGNV